MKMTMALVLVAAAFAVGAMADNHANCKKYNLDFIVTDGDATLKAVEDDIRADLAKIGITVTTRMLAKDKMNTAKVAGDFHLAFSETWGPPYDPQAFANSWATPDEAYYSALKGLPKPLNQTELAKKITAVQKTTTEAERTAGWKEILTVMHDQATEMPLSGKRIPAVINKRLTGYVSGEQQFEYNAHTLKVVSGSDTITVAPGSQSGLFSGVGRLDPHTTRPNEFWSNNWIYEGLTAYGQNGQILPALAQSWTTSTDGKTFTFKLRPNVKFHDGEAWTCAVAKLNFDHVLAKPLTTGDWHGWYGMVTAIDSWSCSDAMTLVVVAKHPYYPMLQELAFIRPLRMQSPKMFVGGATSNPLTQNSCHKGWGTNSTIKGVDMPTKGQNMTVVCAGIVGGGVMAGGKVAGTGRWMFDSIGIEGTGDKAKTMNVTFKAFTGHWEPPTGAYVKTMIVKRYDTSAAVKAALLDKSLDAVLGSGPLSDAEVANFQKTQTKDFAVVMTVPIQNRIVVINTAKAPTNDLALRKIIVQAVDKQAIIDKEMSGLAQPATSLFPKSAPYAKLETNSVYNYAAAYAANCPKPTTPSSTTPSSGASGTVAGFVGMLFAFVAIF